MSDHETSSSGGESWGWFEVERLEPKTARWRQAALLATGVFGLWAAHDIARWPSDPATLSSRTWSAFITVVAVWMVARAARHMIESFDHCQARVFRSRHLLVCSLMLLSTAALLAAALVLRNPFSRLLAHGSVTGPDLVDLGHAVATGICLVAAARAIIGTHEAVQQERRWDRAL